MLALAVLAAAAAATPPNILLVTIDTLRADHLRAYGYPSIETPATDRLAREGVLVEDATVQVPQTRPSHASILTGRLPYEHGIRDNYSPPLDAARPTLATILRGHGYDTAAFIGAFVLSKPSGLDRGFDLYDDPFATGGSGPAPTAAVERPAKQVVDSALAWLVKPRSRPFFAWLHLYDPHLPYEPPAPFARRYGSRPYDGEIAYADAQLGRILGLLDQKGLAGRTLVVVTSDHGEGLGEHGEDAHLMFVYDSTLRVPLLVRWPGVLPAAKRVPGPFRSVDLVATILDLAGLPEVATSGASHAGALKSGRRIPENESYAESLFGQLHFGYAPLRALRAEGWKLIDAPRPELYNLRDDPGETKNLLDVRGQVASRMKGRLEAYDTGTSQAALAAPTDAATMERLATLGYLGGTAPRSGAGSGADPKDKIQEFQAFSRSTQEAMRLYNDGDLEGAIALFAPLAKGEAVSLEVEYFLGKSLLGRKRYPEAARSLERALRLSPRWGPTYLDLSRAFIEMGERDKALSVLDRGLALEPGNPAFHRARGLLLQRLGDLAGAQEALEKAKALDPRDARLRLALAAVYRDRQDLPRALAEAREAARLAPASSDGWNALGILLRAAGKGGEAAEAFRSALKANPSDPDALFGLAETEAEAGRPQEAARLLEKLVSKVPRYPGAAAALDAARGRRNAEPGVVHLRLMRMVERARAEDVGRRLREGGDFANLARSSSVDPSGAQGGDLGAVRLVDLAEPLRSAAAALVPGAVSPILETASGYVILKRER